MNILAIALIAVFAFVVQTVSAQTIRINEVSPNNTSFVDEDGDESDWIELFNPGGTPVRLGGYRIADRRAMPEAWELPDTVLPAGKYMLLYASGKNRTSSQLTAVYGSGAGVNPWNTWDMLRYLYVPVQGDFDMVLRVHSLQKVGTYSKVGLMFMDEPVAENRHAAVFATTRDVFTFSLRTTTHQPPAKVTDLGLPIEFPHTWMRLRREGDSIYAYASLLGDSWEPVDSAECPVAGEAGYIGIAVASDHDTKMVRTTISDPVLNGKALGIEEFAVAEIATKSAGYQMPSRELHTDFGLKSEGETIYLWNDKGALIDSLTFGPMRPDVTCGYLMNHAGPGYYEPGTPLEMNNFYGDWRIAQAPQFSLPGGRYDDNQEIEITADPRDRVFYTLDGSEPDTLSEEYFIGTIALSSTATLRARAFALGALPSDIRTATYLIRETTQLPVVALATAPSGLWGPDGIFDHPFNDVEVPLHVEMWESDGEPALALDAGVKVHGRITRTLPQKSLRLYARNRYGVGEFDYPVFPSKPIKAYDRLILRNAGQDWYSTFMRDALFASLVAELQFDVQAYRPVTAFLNGQYWGIYTLRERIDEKFIAQNHDVEEENIDLLEEKAFPRTGSSLAYHTMTDSLSKLDMADTSAYAYADSVIDLGSFTDYMVAEIFASAGDWPQYNQKFWRERKEGGRWRWVMSDVDMGMGLNDDTTAYKRNTLAIATSPTQDVIINPPYSTFLLRTLLGNERFHNDFINRTADILNTTLHTDRVIRFIDSLAAGIAGEVPRHVERWDTSLSNWDAEVEKLKYFARHRQEEMRSHYVKKFELEGTVQVTLATLKAGTGTIRFSTILPPALPWSGIYFKNVPITATAIPAPGYRFVRWDTPDVGDSSTVVVTLQQDMELVAVFVPSDAPEAEGIVINEIMYKPSDDRDSKDWIELYNSSQESVNLGGWMLKDEDDEHVYSIPSGTVLPAGGYLILSNDTEAFDEIYGDVQCEVLGNVDFGFGTPADQVRLYDGSGLLVDSVAYRGNSPWPTDASGTGRSIELLHPELDNTQGENWRSSQLGGTPGLQNGPGTDVPLEPTLSLIGLTCFPNPVAAGEALLVQCHVQKAGQVVFTIADDLGRVLAGMRHSGVYREGEFTHSVETSSLAPGMYFLRAELTTSAGTSVRVLPFVVK